MELWKPHDDVGNGHVAVGPDVIWLSCLLQISGIVYAGAGVDSGLDGSWPHDPGAGERVTDTYPSALLVAEVYGGRQWLRSNVD